MDQQINQHDAAATAQHLADYRSIIDIDFSFAFQPIVRLDTQTVIGHEALVRGLSGESAATVIAAIGPENRYFFDQACRMQALEVAGRLGMTGDVHLNCTQIGPETLQRSIAATRACAERSGIDPSQVVLEFGNLELLGGPCQLDATRKQAEAAGFRVLADNVGAGEVGLKRLAVLRPEYAKLDRSLVERIESSPRRQAIAHGLIATCNALGIRVIAAGVETHAERQWLRSAGVRFAQGYLFARPAFESAPRVERAVCAA